MHTFNLDKSLFSTAIGYAPAVINSQEEYDFIRAGVTTLCDARYYFIEGSSDLSYSTLRYPQDYRPNSRGMSAYSTNSGG